MVTLYSFLKLEIKVSKTIDEYSLRNNKKPRGFMENCFPFLYIWKFVVIFIIFL